MTRRRWWPVLAVCLVAAACGQKPGTHDESSDLPDIIVQGGGLGAGTGGTGTGGTGTGGMGGTGTGGTGTGGTGTGGTGTGGTGGTGTGGTGAGGETGTGPGGGGGEALTLEGSDRTGVDDDTITLAVHAPVTGAAPLPSVAFERARDLYWRYVTEIQGETVLGRSNVEVLFRDDQYTPATARQACRELAADAFLVVGGGGTDQIQACGQFAEQASVPYLSPGVTEAGLRGLHWYFAASMSYAEQADLLAQYVKANFGDARVGAIVTDTPNFDDAVDAWEDAVGRQGLNYARTLRHPKGNNSWITSYGRELQGEGVEVVFMLTAPGDYIQFAQQAGTQGYRPQYVGVGVSKGLNAVLGSGCPDVDGGIFFSPYPGLDWARENIPEYFAAGQQLGVPTDDLGLALWSLARVQHEMFKRYEATYGSTDLTREDFVRMLERQQAVDSGVFPQLTFTPEDHFGASQVHVLQADCGTGEHRTLATFASGF